MYKAIDYLFREYVQVVKILFDIDVRLFNYNLELNASDRHVILHTCSSAVSFIVLTVNPFTHCILYIVIMNMIDVVDLNRILLYILLLRISKSVNLTSRQFLLRPHQRMDDANVICQLVYLLLNYHNVNVAIPVLFQLIDEMSNLNYFFKDLLSVHDSLLSTDTWIKQKLLFISVKLGIKKTEIFKTKLMLMSVIVFISFLYSSLATTGEIVFYYYAVGRIAHAYRYEVN